MFVAPASNEFSSSSFKAIAGLKITYLTISKDKLSDIAKISRDTIRHRAYITFHSYSTSYKPRSENLPEPNK